MAHRTHYPFIPGELPVRGLVGILLDWFYELDEEFLLAYREEMRFNGLPEKISYRIDAAPISDQACVTQEKGIELYETFLQYLWCLSYAGYVFFREGFMNPHMAGTFKGVLDVGNPFMKKAEAVLQLGLSLRTEYSPERFDGVPNPIEHDAIDKDHVEKANAIFAAAASFIIVHEFAHFYMGHVGTVAFGSQSKADESAADAYALHVIRQSMGKEQRRDVTHILGVTTALTSLMLLTPDLRGGEDHPDPDERLRCAVEILGVEDESQWAAISMGLYLWCKTHPHEIMVPRKGDSFKDFFYLVVNQMREHKTK